MSEEEYYNKVIDDLLHSEVNGRYLMNKIGHVKSADEYIKTVFNIFGKLSRAFDKFSDIIAKYPTDNVNIHLANIKARSYNTNYHMFATDFSYIYSFTTENIAGYIKEFALKDRSLLTVGSSGDQVINAILYDCQDITHFDCNVYCKYYIYLKLACLLELTREEYLNFLVSINEGNINPEVFNKATFMKIKDSLNALNRDSYYFWQQLLEFFEPSKILKVLFQYSKRAYLKYVNPYLASDEAYEKTKAKLSNVNISFINGNVLTTSLSQKFDNIWLSNICGYLSKDENGRVVRKLLSNLNSDGKMLMTYIYDDRDSHISISEYKKYAKILKLNHEVKKFPGIKEIENNSDYVDKALIYYKR